MEFKLIILGSNSAFQAFGRFPSAQVIQYNHQYFLIDCGEGTQNRLSKNKIKRSKIDHIFISHMHGDHVFGLPGLLTSYAQLGRTKELHLYGPVGIKMLMQTIFDLSGSRINFDILYHELVHPNASTIYEDENMAVTAFPLQHRIETFGYRFQEKLRERNMRKEMIAKYQLTTEQILDAKSGIDIEWNGEILKYEDLVHETESLRSYAYCSDTAYAPEIVPFIKDVKVLYHETTFMNDLEDLAAWSRHTTTGQACQIAKAANAEKLITGHYSSRYKDLEPLINEVRKDFPNAELGLEGKVFNI